LKTRLRVVLIIMLLALLMPAPVYADDPAPQAESGTTLYMPVVSVPYAPPAWVGPFGGSVVCIRYSPVQSGLVYAGSWGGGVYRSADGGLTWSSASAGLENLYINSLAVDPTNAAVAYAGTYGKGIFKTTDGGASWKAINSGVYSGAIVYAIAVDPKNPQRVYIGSRPELTDSGPPWNAVLYRSYNGGASWEKALYNVGGGDAQDWVYSIAIDPHNPQVVLAATHEHGPYRSTNYGDSWQAVSSGISDGSGRSVVFAPASSSGVAYFGVWHRSGIFKSSNSGVSWSIKTSGISDSKIYVLDVSPRNASLLYAATFASSGGAGILKSTNAGESWSLAGLQSELAYTVAASPANSNEALAGLVDAGIYRTTNAAGSWSASNSGQTNLQVVSVAVHPLNSSLLAAAVPGRGVAASTNGGASWWWANGGLGDTQVNWLAADPNHPDVLYALTESGSLYKASWNGGLAWSLVRSGYTQSRVDSAADDLIEAAERFTPPVDPVQDFTRPDGAPAETDAAAQSGAGLRSMAFSASNANVIYLGTAGTGVYRSANAGATWNGAGLSGYLVYSLAVDAANANHVYAAINSSDSVRESWDGGATWSGSGLANVAAVSVAAAGDDSQIAYAGGAGLYRRSPAGVWSAAGLNGVSLTAVGVSPFNHNLVLAGGGGTLYISTDGAESWHVFSALFSGVGIQSISFDANDPHTAYIGTTSRATARVSLP
jgi:hypothetical protein